MARLLLITCTVVCAVLLASNAVSVQANTGGLAPVSLVSTLSDVGRKDADQTKTVFQKTIGTLTSSPIPEKEECDPTNGHSCAPHLLSSGQSATVSGVGQKDAQTLALIAAPDDRERAGLFRPPINIS